MEFTFNGRQYPVTVTRKKMKRIIMKVRTDGMVCVSAPLRCADSDIARALQQNAAALAQMVGEAERRADAAPDYSDGSSVPYLGGRLTLHYAAAPGKTIREDGVLTLFARDPQEAYGAYRQWLAADCTELYRELNREVWTAFRRAGYDVPLARVEIKDMVSRWGSCTASSGRISMNIRLMEYPIGCVRGTFYHEYAHFLHQDHSAAFYAVVRQLYPEYDRWDALLKHR